MNAFPIAMVASSAVSIIDFHFRVFKEWPGDSIGKRDGATKVMANNLLALNAKKLKKATHDEILAEDRKSDSLTRDVSLRSRNVSIATLHSCFTHRSSVPVPGQTLTPLVGQAIFLQAAVGLVRNGHFNQPVGQSRFEVAFAEGFAV